MDFDSLQEDGAIPESANQPGATDITQPEPQSQATDGDSSFDNLTDDSEKYTSPIERAKAGVEGFERGMTFGLSDLYRTKIEPHIVPDSLQTSQADIAGRQEQNPIESGVGSFLGSTAALVVTGAALPEIAGVGKIGSAAIKGAIDTGLIQGGDELSKAMLGHGDPETPVASALAHIGAASVMGAGIGGAFGVAGKGLKALADTKIGSKTSQFIEDFGNRWKFNQENPELADAVTGELKNFHDTTSEAADEVYGATGLKSQAIQKLVPPMNDAISAQNQSISNTLQSKISEMIKDPDAYPSHLTKKLTGDANRWMEVATNPQASSFDIFNATQELKQQLQAYSKFDRPITKLSPEYDFVNAAKELQSGLVQNLEDKKVWGGAGDLQKGVNKAFSEFMPSLKDFRGKFMTKVQGEHVIEPGKVATYVNQLGKASGQTKQEILGNYVNAAEKYRGRIEDLHHQLGLESPLEPSSLNAIKGTLGEGDSLGAKAADKMFHVGVPGFAARTAHGVAGAELGREEIGGVKGAMIGGAAGLVAPYLEQAIGRKLTRSAVPAALRVLTSDNVKGISQAIDYANMADSGAQKITRGLDYIFKSGATQPVHAYATEQNREKLKKYVENGDQNQAIKEQLSQMPGPQSPLQPQGFAEGGEVKKQFSQISKPAAPILNGTDPIADNFPTQNIMLNAAKGRINNYLNSVRPQPNTSNLPFDQDHKDKKQDRDYDKVLDMANQPLSILNDIKDGTLTPEKMKHFTSLYPEIYSHLSKQMTGRITKAQLSDERPPYHVRQSLSLFLGAPLESSMTPAGIQAAQNVYAQKRATQAGSPSPEKNKKGTSSLSKISQSYETGDQARLQRQQKT